MKKIIVLFLIYFLPSIASAQDSMQAMLKMMESQIPYMYNKLWLGNTDNRITDTNNDIDKAKTSYDLFEKSVAENNEEGQEILAAALISINLAKVKMLKVMTEYPDPGYGKADYYITRQKEWLDDAQSWFNLGKYGDCINSCDVSLSFSAKAAEQLDLCDGYLDEADQHIIDAYNELKKLAI